MGLLDNLPLMLGIIAVMAICLYFGYIGYIVGRLSVFEEGFEELVKELEYQKIEGGKR